MEYQAKRAAGLEPPKAEPLFQFYRWNVKDAPAGTDVLSLTQEAAEGMEGTGPLIFTGAGNVGMTIEEFRKMMSKMYGVPGASFFIPEGIPIE